MYGANDALRWLPESEVSLLLLESLGVVCESSDSTVVCSKWWWGPLDNDEVEGVDVNLGSMTDGKWLFSLCDVPDDSTIESVYQQINHIAC